MSSNEGRRFFFRVAGKGRQAEHTMSSSGRSRKQAMPIRRERGPTGEFLRRGPINVAPRARRPVPVIPPPPTASPITPPRGELREQLAAAASARILRRSAPARAVTTGDLETQLAQERTRRGMRAVRKELFEVAGPTVDIAVTATFESYDVSLQKWVRQEEVLYTKRVPNTTEYRLQAIKELRERSNSDYDAYATKHNWAANHRARFGTQTSEPPPVVGSGVRRLPFGDMPMRHLSLKYDSLGLIQNEEEDGLNCVTSYLKKEYGARKGYIKHIKGLIDLGSDHVWTPNELLEKFAKPTHTSMRAYDLLGKEQLHYDSEADNSNKKMLTFIAANDHMYPLKPGSISSIIRRNSNREDKLAGMKDEKCIGKKNAKNDETVRFDVHIDELAPGCGRVIYTRVPEWAECTCRDPDECNGKCKRNPLNDVLAHFIRESSLVPSVTWGQVHGMVKLAYRESGMVIEFLPDMHVTDALKRFTGMEGEVGMSKIIDSLVAKCIPDIADRGSVFVGRDRAAFDTVRPLIATYDAYRNQCDDLRAFDICKAHSAVLECPYRFGWSTFVPAGNSIVPYDGRDIEEGLYLVAPRGRGMYQTVKNEYSLMGDGERWYSDDFVHYALMVGEITREDIKFMRLADKTIDEAVFAEMVNDLYENVGDKVAKTACNIMVGMWGRREIKTKKSLYTSSEHDASHYRNEHKMHASYNRRLGLYEMKRSDGTECMETFIPWYNKVQDNLRIWIDVFVKMSHGSVVEIQTDKVIINGAKVQTTKGGVRGTFAECGFELKNFTERKIVQYKTSSALTMGEYNRKLYNIEPVYEAPTDDDPHGNRSIVSAVVGLGNGCFVSARAGCGKTTLAIDIHKFLNGVGKKHLMLAYTHAAKELLPDGQTIHNALSIDTDGFTNASVCKRLVSEKIEYIICDEVSMLTYDILKVMLYIRKHSNIRFVFLGEYKQLPPIDNKNDYDYGNMSIVSEITDYQRLTLTRNYRNAHAARIDRVLSEEESLRVSKTDGDEDCVRFITRTNRERRRLNVVGMERDMRIKNVQRYEDLPYEREEFKKVVGESREAREKRFDAYIERATRDPRQSMMLYVGLEVVAWNNEYKNGENEAEVRNSYRYRIVEFSESEVTIQRIRTGAVHTIKKGDVHRYFVMGFAQTVHKAQGQTYNFKYHISEVEKIKNIGREQNGWYVAISRATDLDMVTVG